MSNGVCLETQGIKYMGTKNKLLPHIFRVVKGLPVESVFDGFSGTTRVSQLFAKNGYKVVSNDKGEWSKVFATCYLLNKNPPSYYRELIEHLNSVEPIDGWFTEHYGGEDNNGSSIQADGLKKPWQKHNTMKLDGVRQEIENLGLSDVEEAVCLTSLILALDKVDNTLGHFSSYLAKWYPKSYKTFNLEVPLLYENQIDHEVLCDDIFNVLPSVETDLTYYDPPYMSGNEKTPHSRVRYLPYYHLWKSICLNDKPNLFGKDKRREESSDTKNYSPFEDYRVDESGLHVSVQSIGKLVEETQSKYILLSYSTRS